MSTLIPKNDDRFPERVSPSRLLDLRTGHQQCDPVMPAFSPPLPVQYIILPHIQAALQRTPAADSVWTRSQYFIHERLERNQHWTKVFRGHQKLTQVMSLSRSPRLISKIVFATIINYKNSSLSKRFFYEYSGCTEPCKCLDQTNGFNSSAKINTFI